MSLSCHCYYDFEPGSIVYYPPQDYTAYPNSRATRCKSCKKKIKNGDICIEFLRHKIPESEVEYKIYGEDGEVPRASYFHCEECADLFFSLYELGFTCIAPDDNMKELVKEYAEVYRWEKFTDEKSDS